MHPAMQLLKLSVQLYNLKEKQEQNFYQVLLLFHNSCCIHVKQYRFFKQLYLCLLFFKQLQIRKINIILIVTFHQEENESDLVFLDPSNGEGKRLIASKEVTCGELFAVLRQFVFPVCSKIDVVIKKVCLKLLVLCQT